MPDPDTGFARLSYGQARALLDEHTAVRGPGTRWVLRECRHSSLTHLGEQGASLLMLMANRRTSGAIQAAPRGNRRAHQSARSRRQPSLTAEQDLTRSMPAAWSGADCTRRRRCCSLDAAVRREGTLRDGDPPIPGP